jgi:3-oxoacyl-[acyl-carrier protein] reductase
LFYAVDMMHDDHAAHKTCEHLLSAWGRVDIIVHSLGGTLEVRDSLSSSVDYSRVWKLNLGIAIDLNNILLPFMIKQKWGRVVHVSSSAAVQADASLPYSSAKAAVNTYVKGLGRSVAKDGVVLSAVMPGPVSFDDNKWRLMQKNDPQAYAAFMQQHMPLLRAGTPEEISAAIVFLCSVHASFCPGIIMSVDGGMH